MRIDFYMATAMLAWHYAPIVRALIDLGVDARFVSPRGEDSPVRDWYEEKKGIVIIEKTGLPVVHAPDPNADMAVAFGPASLLKGYKKRKARLMYGCGVAGDSTHLRKEYYDSCDLVMVHGPFHRSIASARIDPRRVAVVGFPRYDDWFNGQFDVNAVKTRFAAEKKRKPSLLYLPTWGDRSSIDRFADAVFSLSDSFDILVKPHHGTGLLEKDRMQRLFDGPATVLDYLMDPKEAYARADLILGDLTSGAFTEPILLRKKVIGIGTEEEYKSIFHPDIASIVPTCTNPQNLPSLVDNVFRLPIHTYTENLRADLFGTTEGRDAYVAANALIENIEEMPTSDPTLYYRVKGLNLLHSAYAYPVYRLKVSMKKLFPKTYKYLRNIKRRVPYSARG